MVDLQIKAGDVRVFHRTGSNGDRPPIAGVRNLHVGNDLHFADENQAIQDASCHPTTSSVIETTHSFLLVDAGCPQLISPNNGLTKLVCKLFVVVFFEIADREETTSHLLSVRNLLIFWLSLLKYSKTKNMHSVFV